jgi:hypothetical protein
MKYFISLLFLETNHKNIFLSLHLYNTPPQLANITQTVLLYFKAKHYLNSKNVVHWQRSGVSTSCESIHLHSWRACQPQYSMGPCCTAGHFLRGVNYSTILFLDDLCDHRPVAFTSQTTSVGGGAFTDDRACERASAGAGA